MQKHLAKDNRRLYLILIAISLFIASEAKEDLQKDQDILKEADSHLRFLSDLNENSEQEKRTSLKGSPLDGLIAGIGYSSDTQSLGKAVCFQTDRIIKSGQSSVLKFDEALDYKTLLQTFSMEIDIKGGYGIFSTNDMFKYFKSLESDSYSLSINYYQKVSQSNILTYSYDQQNILTAIGNGIYKNNTNPLFRLLCGDTLIGAFEEGALLIVSMKILFNSKEEKSQFDSKIGVSFGSFLDASASISQVSQQYSLNGKVQISGFQLGGDPSQLSKLLSASIVECDVKNTAACQETAKNLINYVSQNFPEQFKKDETGIWTSPLVPLTQFKKDYKLEDLGFALSPSFITQEVEVKRNNLLSLFNENNYYFKNLSYMLKAYPAQLDTVFASLLNSFSSNLSLLISGDSYGNKALDCFEFPFKCEQSYNSLLSSINTEAKGKLDALLVEFKSYSSFGTALYATKCLPQGYEWKINIDVKMQVFPIGNGKFGLSLGSNALQFSTPQVDNLGSFSFDAVEEIFNWKMTVNAQKTDEDNFKGSFRCVGKNFALDESYQLVGLESGNPFYFEPYAQVN